MSRLAGLFGSNALSAVVVGGVALGGVGLYFKGVILGAPEPDVIAEPVESVPKAVLKAGEAETAQPAPSFDVVRVEPDGQSLIAGRAAPDAKVQVQLDGVTVAEAETDADGKFVAFATLPLSDTPKVLRLLSEGVESDASVIVAPRVAEGEEPATEPETQVASAQPQSSEGITSGSSLAAADLEEEGNVRPVSEEIEAPNVILADERGVRLLQGQTPEALTSVALDLISYDAAGDVELAGRAPEGGFVRVYLDNKPVTAQTVDAQGNWQADLPDVDTGVYELRVDKVSADGKVESRVVTPFQREAPETLAEVHTQQRVVTVQAGATLWAIAEARYGDGLRYVQVFDANRDRIRNPDLIYPGQIFDMPALSGG